MTIFKNKNKLIEIAGILLFLLFFFITLSFSYSIKAWSDPARWYTFGVSFPDAYFVSHLAYGFPLILFIASKIVGLFYAFLINIPILTLMFGIFYLFSKAIIVGNNWSNTKQVVFAFASISSMLLLNHEMVIITLTNPYRDPIAFVFLLLSCILVVRYVHLSFKNNYLISLSALMLAFSVSCRETTGLIVIPIFLYLVYYWWNKRYTLFLRDGIKFVFFLVVGMLPWLFQNYFVSGNPIIPAQAVDNIVRTGSISAIIPSGSLLIIPRTLIYLIKHNGMFFTITGIIGLFVAFKRKNAELVYICFGGALVFMLFYFTYPKIMPRYLMVIDLFSIPISIYGCFSFFSWLSERYKINITKRVYLIISICLMLSPLLFYTGRNNSRITINDMNKFKNDINSLMGKDAVVFTEPERNIVDLLRCFSSSSPRQINRYPYFNKHGACYTDLSLATIMLLKKQNNIRVLFNWNLTDGLYIYDHPLFAALETCEARNYLQRKYDFLKDYEIKMEKYSLNQYPFNGEFVLSEIKRWDNENNFVKEINNITNSTIIVLIDLKHLYSYKRKSVTVKINDKIVDGNPFNNMNCYSLELTNGAKTIRVEVQSDGVLSDDFNVITQPLTKPIIMNVNSAYIHLWKNRFSGSFFHKSFPRYLGIYNSGTIDIPTVTKTQNDLLVTLNAAWGGTDKNGKLKVKIGNAALIGDVILVNNGWQPISFTLPRRYIVSSNTKIDLQVYSDDKAGALWIRQIKIIEVK